MLTVYLLSSDIGTFLILKNNQEGETALNIHNFSLNFSIVGTRNTSHNWLSSETNPHIILLTQKSSNEPLEQALKVLKDFIHTRAEREGGYIFEDLTETSK